MLFFNEYVTFANRQEVFDDIYARGQEDAPNNKPLRGASVLIYLKKSMLGEILY